MNLNAPNIISLSRIGMAPILIYLLMYTGPTASALAGAVFLVATLSDFLDGYLARNYGSGSTLGKFLDPLADKIVVSVALIMLAGMNRAPRVPAWMVAVLVTREIAVTALRAMAASEGGLVVAADDMGKYKMVAQALAIQGLLIHYTYFHIDFFAAGMFLLWIAMVLAVWSGFEYYIKFMQLLAPSRAASSLSERTFDKRRAGG